MKAILEAREKAKSELGAKFDLKAYHALVLNNGAMPLWLLQRNVTEWVKDRR